MTTNKLVVVASDAATTLQQQHSDLIQTTTTTSSNNPQPSSLLAASSSTETKKTTTTTTSDNVSATVTATPVINNHNNDSISAASKSTSSSSSSNDSGRSSQKNGTSINAAGAPLPDNLAVASSASAPITSGAKSGLDTRLTATTQQHQQQQNSLKYSQQQQQQLPDQLQNVSDNQRIAATTATTTTTTAPPTTSQLLGVQVRQRVSQASDHLGQSLRQLYASASSITTAAADTMGVQAPPPLYHNLPGIVPYYHGRSAGPPPSYDDVINPYAAPPTYQSLFGQMREARKTSRGLVDLLRRLLIILASTLGCTLLIAFMILIPFTMIIIGAIYIDDCRIEHIPAFLLVGGLVWASKNVLHCYTQCKKQSVAEQVAAAALAADDLYAAATAAAAANRHPVASGSSMVVLAQPPPPVAVTSTTTTTTTTNNEQQPLPDGLGTLASTMMMIRPTTNNDDTVINQSTIYHQQQQQQQQTTVAASTTTQQNNNHHNNNNNNNRRLKSSICESLLNCILFGWFIAGCVIVFRNYEPDFIDSSSLRYCNRTVYMYTFWLITSAMLLFGLFISCICCLMVSSAVASRQDELDMA